MTSHNKVETENLKYTCTWLYIDKKKDSLIIHSFPFHQHQIVDIWLYIDNELEFMYRNLHTNKLVLKNFSQFKDKKVQIKYCTTYGAYIRSIIVQRKKYRKEK